MSALDDLNSAITSLQAVATELSVPAVESVGDTFLASAVAALEAAGYTVTAPATDNTDTSTEA